MRSHRILRLITRLNAGGPTRHAVWLAEGLRGRGWETVLAAGMPVEAEDDLRSFAQEKRVEVREVRGLSRDIRAGAEVTAVRDVVRLIREVDPAIVHTHTSKAGFVGRVAAALVSAARRPGRRIVRVHTFHGHVLAGYFPPLKTRVFRTVESLLGHLVTEATIALTDQQRIDLVERFHVSAAGRTYIVPLGLDLVPFERLPSGEPLRREWNVAPDAFLVGMVGRIAPIKNHELFLRAATRLRAKVSRARFVVVGGGERVGALRQLAASLGIGGDLVFAGTRTDLPAVYAAMDVVALSSRNEGTPLSLIEAMAAGKPIVATEVGGVRDLLTREWQGGVLERRFRPSARPRGLLVASDDAEVFADNLASLASAPALAQELGSAGRAYAFEFHALDRLLTDLDELYRTLLSRGPRRASCNDSPPAIPHRI